jgi:ribosomal protein L29
MTLDEIKKLSKEALEKHIIDWKKDLMKLRISAKIQKKADKPHMFKEIKRRIARAHTQRRALETKEVS